ncbi:tripartite tricarboxylate transporter substrate binding protein [Bacillus sp. Marseille-P3661]|uniref:tripartite tricarboxylate transporter substrate binding protein n=1 Tax=Bacillus sp. Marseille-P3661 TaxID=1936234 RepID=UPI002155195E|nr:tripartite tricarboxylate transporter substrate binding protein [Bacillus sp. Marseille-P3661]
MKGINFKELKMSKAKRKVTALLTGGILLTMLLAGCASSSTTPESATESEKTPEVSSGDYPNKPVQIITPTGSGGDTDINARVFSKYMEKELGQPFVVTNVTGAGGVIGSRQVKDAAPDGYTALFFHYGTLTQTLMGTADFFILDDFDVVGIPILDNTSVIVTKKGKYKDMKELLDDAKARPGKVNFAIETGTVAHLAGRIIEDQAGVDFNLVDTGAAATKNAALLSGQSDGFFAQYLAVKEYVKSGDFELIGLVADERNPGMPDVPTLKEQGIDFALPKFFYFAFPKGTPDEIESKFQEAMQKVVSNPEAIEEFEKDFLELKYLDPSASADLINQTKDIFAGYVDEMK